MSNTLKVKFMVHLKANVEGVTENIAEEFIEDIETALSELGDVKLNVKSFNLTLDEE